MASEPQRVGLLLQAATHPTPRGYAPARVGLHLNYNMADIRGWVNIEFLIRRFTPGYGSHFRSREAAGLMKTLGTVPWRRVGTAAFRQHGGWKPGR